jgi:hypothetical protein
MGQLQKTAYIASRRSWSLGRQVEKLAAPVDNLIE